MMIDVVHTLLGADGGPLTAPQMALRAVLVYGALLLVLRIGSGRLLGKATTFDAVVAILIGSVMSGAVDGSSPFLPTIAAGAALVLVHWVLAALAFHTHWLGPLVKGKPLLLVKDGALQTRALQRAKLTKRDLEEALRSQGHDTDVTRIQRAYLERDGSVSVVAG